MSDDDRMLERIFLSTVLVGVVACASACLPVNPSSLGESCEDDTDCFEGQYCAARGGETVCVASKDGLADGGGDETDSGGTADADVDTGRDVIVGMGPLDCTKVYQCVLDCEDPECRRDCKRQGTKTATEDFRSLEDCREAECADADNPRQCLLENCGTRYEECGLTGEDACDRALACATTCSEDGCERSCVREGSLGAQRRYADLTSCSSNRCSDVEGTEARLSCMARKCEQELNACQATGRKTCREATICRQMCGEEPARCRRDCGFEAEALEQLDVWNLQSCRAENGCDGGNLVEQRICMVDHCSTRLEDCGLTGTDDCQSIADAWSACNGRVECQLAALSDGELDAQRKLSEWFQCIVANNCSAGDCEKSVPKGKHVQATDATYVPSVPAGRASAVTGAGSERGIAGSVPPRQ